MSKRRPAPSPRRAPRVSKRPAAPQARQVTARIAGDRRAAELLQLEMRRLARRLGLKVDSVRIRRVTPTT
jgi:hypothetical protein